MPPTASIGRFCQATAGTGHLLHITLQTYFDVFEYARSHIISPYISVEEGACQLDKDAIGRYTQHGAEVARHINAHWRRHLLYFQAIIYAMPCIVFLHLHLHEVLTFYFGGLMPARYGLLPYSAEHSSC